MLSNDNAQNGTDDNEKKSELGNGSTKNLSRADFLLLEELGEGSYSTVYLGSEKSSGRKFAVKECNKQHIKRENKVKEIFREKEVLSILSTPENLHPFIIRLYCTFQDPDSLYFVQTLAQRNDLQARLKKLKLFEVKLTRTVMAELISALAHIHNLGIIHRDVKPENILVNKNGHILLSDFGCAKNLRAQETEKNDSNQRSAPPGRQRKKSFVGSAHYVSPEVLQGEETTTSVDYWACGVMLFQLLTGHKPFNDASEYLIYQRILKLLFSRPLEDVPDQDATDLIKKFLVINPAERLGSLELGGADRIRQHNFFHGTNWDNLSGNPPPFGNESE